MDDENCDCRCHGSNDLNLRHFLPCCHKCDGCGKMIKTLFIKFHEPKCLNRKIERLFDESKAKNKKQ